MAPADPTADDRPTAEPPADARQAAGSSVVGPRNDDTGGRAVDDAARAGGEGGVLAAARRWLALDPDEGTAGELARALAVDPDRVAEEFDGRIGFGTAGLRAEMGFGPQRMNRLVVLQTTAGLLRWLGPGATVVVAHDARHNSERFALDTAAVVAGAGGRAELIRGPVPTPVLARAVLDREADAGVMITASHNPPQDNGYKLYLGDGIQLVSPADTEIAALIDAVAAEMVDPSRSDDEAAAIIPVEPDAVVALGPDVLDRHAEAAVAACVTGHRSVRVLYTAMHGVGGAHVVRCFEQAGFTAPAVVLSQFEPDPEFSTVGFPNPEEPGALDESIAAATAIEAGGDTVDVILANDPDADRLAVAVHARGSGDGAGHGEPQDGWVRLTGDQVGVLLADHLLRHRTGPGRLVASSIVSSRLLGRMAVAAGVEALATLTGFKWLARPIVDRPEATYVLGYEEAIGYCVGDRVRDKDGISAALVMAELVAEATEAGETLWDRLDRLALDHGLHVTAPVTIRYDGPDGDDARRAAMDRARTEPPARLASVTVSAVEDLAEGDVLPPTDGVVWDLVDGGRVVVRPSGTEPKLKAYLEIVESVAGRADLDGARHRAEEKMAALRSAVDELLRSGTDGS